MEWFFDGLGTEIISVVISLIVGGFVGYKIGVKKSAKQKQQAGDTAKQEQKVRVDDSTVYSRKKKTSFEISIDQTQKAGDYSSQTQIGEIKDVRK